MAYTPTDWKHGDVVTSEKLNNAEIGIEDAHAAIEELSEAIEQIDPGSLFAIKRTTTGGSTHKLDKTWAEIETAFKGGKTVLVYADTDSIIEATNVFAVSQVAIADNKYQVWVDSEEGPEIFTATSQTGTLSFYCGPSSQRTALSWAGKVFDTLYGEKQKKLATAKTGNDTYVSVKPSDFYTDFSNNSPRGVRYFFGDEEVLYAQKTGYTAVRAVTLGCSAAGVAELHVWVSDAYSGTKLTYTAPTTE